MPARKESVHAHVKITQIQPPNPTQPDPTGPNRPQPDPTQLRTLFLRDD